MVRIFLSYRRDDSIHQTGRIHDRLCMRFGKENVFKDVDSIPLGADFGQKIRDAVGHCDALLAVIGDSWLGMTDEQGRRRLDREDDLVRLEIEAALQREIRVIPLLVGTAPMPKGADLPASLRDLSSRQGTPVRPDPDFERDVEFVIRSLADVGEIDRKLHAMAPAARPTILPWPALSVFFKVVANANVGGRSFVLERGTLRGRFYRIRERGSPFSTRYHFWDHFEDEAQAMKYWEEFLRLQQDRERASVELIVRERPTERPG